MDAALMKQVEGACTGTSVVKDKHSKSSVLEFETFTTEEDLVLKPILVGWLAGCPSHVLSLRNGRKMKTQAKSVV
ncbi:hypothetical protein Hdeb2414_s0011g00372631 [Helianthus debilis subsp. tardiflorus]